MVFSTPGLQIIGPTTGYDRQIVSCVHLSIFLSFSFFSFLFFSFLSFFLFLSLSLSL
jgi:hypothetical protein